MNFTPPSLHIVGDPTPITFSEFNRTDVINFCLDKIPPREKSYLEIGVADPSQNFDKVTASYKVGVDPGYEMEAGHPKGTYYKCTSDEFFAQNIVKFDVIYIDGLHLAPQVHRDIDHALECIAPDGYIILHDCNPPTWDRAHSDYADYCRQRRCWNGTSWKAFYMARVTLKHKTCCVDTDEGCGIIAGKATLEKPVLEFDNPFFEYGMMKHFRQQHLGLVSVGDFRTRFEELLV